MNQPSLKQISHFTEASKFLESYSRKIYPILGDGNCLFRALSYLLFGIEDYHHQVRKLLIEVIALNSDIFSQYCTDYDLNKHVARMKYETIWGTDVEIRAAASFLRLPVYVCTQKSKSLEYYWDCFTPLVTKAPSTGDYFSNIWHSKPLPSHLEICHNHRCHYDVITELDGSLPVTMPTLSSAVTHIDLTEE